MKKTIIIAGASCGWGHMQAAHNINKAVSCLRQDWHVETINIHEYLPRSLRFALNNGWRFASSHLDGLYEEFYRYSVTNVNTKHLVGRLVRTSSQRVFENFRDHDIGVFIATHSIAASVGSLLKSRFQYKLCVAATDFVLHSMQIFPNVDFFYLPPMYRQVMDMTSTSENIEKKAQHTGIPIAPEFALHKDKETLRRRFGLSTDLSTILVSFGGTGLRAEKHIELFGNLLDLGLPLQFIVLAGQNHRFATAMRERYGNNKYRDRFKIYNYLDDVSDFYGVADLFIGKAGGLTISEALAAGLPIIIVDALPGQETFNVEVISSNKLGCYVSNLKDLVSEIKDFLYQGMTSSLEKNMDKFARPHSSMNVARHIAGLAV
jgi:processive 1,2-diacylglycerol beta-glucosyltransferase